ncbi:CheY-P-specific phosphatase CheX [Malaciobacter pacificus]|uniref:Two-component system response regulator n=1 Tax=Malaciobacter pacificus TaxID=1080223 RepID=A0A5C2HAZ8_9BACT|nr:response regulator transcription factor [Malaciobacter pacificus]QEP35398.1 two-component system response regulator [Malaciobacter pacificus]GGD38729.1 CheY-P-specific phosphatase CheX [Malaciobacter pacificus]
MERLKSKTILIVEDEKTIRENLASMLKFFFKEVHTAIDGHDGLDKYEQYLPDIVMTDLKMPNMSGFELLEELIKRDSTSYKIIVSAHTDKELLFKAIEKGINRYLVKPIIENELFETFEAYLKNLEKTQPMIIKIDDDIYLESDKKSLFISELEIHLNKKEFLFLKLLLSNDNKTFTYEEIENIVWGGALMSQSAIRSVVRDLRKKIGEKYIINVSGIGYRLK